MFHSFKLLTVCLAASLSLTKSAAAQRVHQIRLEANPAKETFRFSPALVTARPGDVLLFKAGPGVPHSIVFESGGLSEDAHEALNGAMRRRAAVVSSSRLPTRDVGHRLVVQTLASLMQLDMCA